MKKYLSIFITLLLLCINNFIKAQDTFSICAVDPLTGEVGSAGASCIDGSIIISDVHPGHGVVHTQSFWRFANQIYAHSLMNLHLSPQAIIDSLVLHDDQNNPSIRQYGIVDLINGGRSAAYTGVNCFDYKNHIIRPTYAIQGNILLGQQILDSMESRFLNTPGSFAKKLMAALQGAKVIGADTRCIPNNTSSLSAFIRVARPEDTLGVYYIDLEVPNTTFGRDPIDSLQVLFNNIMTPVHNISNEIPRNFSLSQNFPNPFNPKTNINYEIPLGIQVSLKVYDVLGNEIMTLVNEKQNAGSYRVDFDATNFPSGIYYYKIKVGEFEQVKKMILLK